MNKLLQITLPQAIVIVGAMAFLFAFVRTGLGDVKAAGTALGVAVFGVWSLFQTAGGEPPPPPPPAVESAVTP